MDSGEPIVHQDLGMSLWLESDDARRVSQSEVMRQLRSQWSTDLERQHCAETEYVFALASYLQELGRNRESLIEGWLNANLCRFSSEHSEIQNLKRRSEALTRELLAGLEICGLKCSSCNLRCLEGKRHGKDSTM